MCSFRVNNSIGMLQIATRSLLFSAGVPASPATPEAKGTSPETVPKSLTDSVPMQVRAPPCWPQWGVAWNRSHSAPHGVSPSLPPSFPVRFCIQVVAGGKKRKRKRVLKSKTFVDEEGCIGESRGSPSMTHEL